MLEKSSLPLNKNSTIRRERRTKVFFIGILFVMALVAGAIGFLRKSEFQISDVKIVGTRATDANQIMDAARKFMAGNYLLVIPKTNALLFSKTALQKYILDKFPGLKSARADFPQRNTLSIFVAEKQPAYVWCGAGRFPFPSEIGPSIASVVRGCWFADADGVIYDEAPDFSDGVFVQFSGVAKGETLDGDPRRGRFASAAQFVQIREVLAALQSYPVSVLGIRYLDDEQLFEAQPTGPGDMAIRINSIKNTSVNSNAVILTTQDATAETAMQSFNLVMNEGKFADALKANGKNLQYVDLRFDGKIYYKFGQ